MTTLIPSLTIWAYYLITNVEKKISFNFNVTSLWVTRWVTKLWFNCVWFVRKVLDTPYVKAIIHVYIKWLCSKKEIVWIAWNNKSVVVTENGESVLSVFVLDAIVNEINVDLWRVESNFYECCKKMCSHPFDATWHFRQSLVNTLIH